MIMTTLDLIDLLFSFAFGAAVSTVVCLWVHRQHKESWQAEFRRLMAGIAYARDSVLNLNIPRGKVAESLAKTWLGE